MIVRRTVLIIGSIALACVVVGAAIQISRFLATRRHAGHLVEEQGRAAEACHRLGGGGASYITVHAPGDVFNQISFNFRKRQLTDEDLRHLAGLTGVVGLDLSENPITDNGLRYIAQVPHLQWLQLSDTDITNQGIKQLRNLKHLRILDLSYTGITQQAAKDLAAMPALERVDASGTGLRQITGVEVKHHQEYSRTWIRECIERPLRQD